MCNKNINFSILITKILNIIQNFIRWFSILRMSDVVIRRKGTWIEERSIGSGGFGAVTLWKNEVCLKLVVLKINISNLI